MDKQIIKNLTQLKSSYENRTHNKDVRIIDGKFYYGDEFNSYTLADGKNIWSVIPTYLHKYFEYNPDLNSEEVKARRRNLIKQAEELRNKLCKKEK